MANLEYILVILATERAQYTPLISISPSICIVKAPSGHLQYKIFKFFYFFMIKIVKQRIKIIKSSNPRKSIRHLYYKLKYGQHKTVSVKKY